MYCLVGDSAKYYFVKDKNIVVSTYRNDKLISKADKLFDEKCKNLNLVV